MFKYEINLNVNFIFTGLKKIIKMATSTFRIAMSSGLVLLLCLPSTLIALDFPKKIGTFHINL